MKINYQDQILINSKTIESIENQIDNIMQDKLSYNLTQQERKEIENLQEQRNELREHNNAILEEWRKSIIEIGTNLHRKNFF